MKPTNVLANKLDEVRWEIPVGSIPGMSVPGRVYANEALMRKIREDRTLLQCAGVACLPGIHKYAIALPDAHEGYGFPIGGVAALDSHSGGISPGGVGYDINCLSENTEILTHLGYRAMIKDISSALLSPITVSNGYECYPVFRKKTLSFGNGTSRETEVKYLLKTSSREKVFRVTTLLGRTIECSKDHKFMSKNGMKKIEELGEGSEVLTYPFIGVKFTPPSNKEILSESRFDGQIPKELEKRNLIPLRQDSPALPHLLRLIGYVIGDGLVYFSGRRGYVHIYSADKNDLEIAKRDFEDIGFGARIYERKNRRCKIETQYGTKQFTSTSYELHASSRSLALLLKELGVPIGKKTNQNYTVPDWILELPLWMKRLFLSGFFSAELSSPALVYNYNFYTPVLAQNKNESRVESGHKFMEQIADLLAEFGIATCKISLREEVANRQGRVFRLRLIIGSEPENLIRLWSQIGYDYSRKKQRKANVAVGYLLLKQYVTRLREFSEKNARLLKSLGLSAREICQKLSSEFINDRFIERSLYEGRRDAPRVPQNMMRLEDFEARFGHPSGAVFDRIVKIEEVDYDGPLYDLNVADESHNFVANSFVVSNCGVRLLRTNLTAKEVKPKVKELLDEIFRNVPSGVGSHSPLKLNRAEIDDLLERGAEWTAEKGYGWKKDLEHLEEGGRMRQARHSAVSDNAKKRGQPEVGTLGAGNHFLEIQQVSHIFDAEKAKTFGIDSTEQVTVMIHCGSRGLGHQVCSDYIRKIEEGHFDLLKKLPDRELVYAPAGSQLAEQYFAAMSAAANFAWANRQVIHHHVRRAFEKIFGQDAERLGMDVVYDVCHNVCKLEEHEIDGKMTKVYLHRKGATRAFPPGHPEIPADYRSAGQPVLLPGSMGSASYVLAGVPTGSETFFSSAHGAGRMMSRGEAISRFAGKKVAEDLGAKGILVRCASWRVISEEAPQAYKDIDEVAQVTHQAGISKKVARMIPMGVVKG